MTENNDKDSVESYYEYDGEKVKQFVLQHHRKKYSFPAFILRTASKMIKDYMDDTMTEFMELSGCLNQTEFQILIELLNPKNLTKSPNFQNYLKEYGHIAELFQLDWLRSSCMEFILKDRKWSLSMLEVDMIVNYKYDKLYQTLADWLINKISGKESFQLEIFTKNEEIKKVLHSKIKSHLIERLSRDTNGKDGYEKLLNIL